MPGTNRGTCAVAYYSRQALECRNSFVRAAFPLFRSKLRGDLQEENVKYVAAVHTGKLAWLNATFANQTSASHGQAGSGDKTTRPNHDPLTSTSGQLQIPPAPDLGRSR